jgi:hypothetical protein
MLLKTGLPIVDISRRNLMKPKMIISTNLWLKQHRMAIGGALTTIALTACTFAPAQLSAASLSSTVTSSIAASPTPPSSPTQSAGSVESDQQSAVQVIQDYYGAINRQDYQQAYLLWDEEGAASQQSFEQFKQGFANTESTTVTTGEPGNVEGAAGSVYVEIPVTITAVTRSGTQEQFHGGYALRQSILCLAQRQRSRNGTFTRHVLLRSGRFSKL